MEKTPETNLAAEDLSILGILQNRLEEIEREIKSSEKKTDPENTADDDDRIEDSEENENRAETIGVLKEQEKEIQGSISWIEKHGKACAFPGCEDHVDEERRKADPASITCRKHMEYEDDIFKEILMGL